MDDIFKLALYSIIGLMLLNFAFGLMQNNRGYYNTPAGYGVMSNGYGGMSGGNGGMSWGYGSMGGGRM